MGKIKDINQIPTWESRAFGIEIEFVHKPEGLPLSRPNLASKIADKANEYMINSGYGMTLPSIVISIEFPSATPFQCICEH